MPAGLGKRFGWSPPQGLELEKNENYPPLIFKNKIKNKQVGGLFVLQVPNTGKHQ